MSRTLPNRYYYLENFQNVLAWVFTHHRDLLTSEEAVFFDAFQVLPQPSRALFVRMAMRKGELFRCSRLKYDEIGNVAVAARPLLALGWLDDNPKLDALQVAHLLTRPELAQHFSHLIPQKSWPKSRMVAVLLENCSEPRGWREWCPESNETVLQFRLGALCDRLRVMFFGNARQDWSEFVLSDLGILRYESVPLLPGSRAFETRADVDLYLHMHECGQRLASGESPVAVLADLGLHSYENTWLESRRTRLLFRIGVHLEREGKLEEALKAHLGNPHPEARIRAIRVLERLDRVHEACILAEETMKTPRCEAEFQQVVRMVPRLLRTLKRVEGNSGSALNELLPTPAYHESNDSGESDRREEVVKHSDAGVHQDAGVPANHSIQAGILALSGQATCTDAGSLHAATTCIEQSHSSLQLPDPIKRPASALARSLNARLQEVSEPAVIAHTVQLPYALREHNVEHALAQYLNNRDAPVFYVENMLFNGLFGLFFWDILFKPLPGAFFHPFHAGPADLLRPEFYARRAELFEERLTELDNGLHVERILTTYQNKFGLQCWFVNWGILHDDHEPGQPSRLLRLALKCIPPEHLKLIFKRLCKDVRNNGSGFPDLIQFFPDRVKYELVEVKGPGDRLRDNQLRWLHYLSSHGVPAKVCHVNWKGDHCDEETSSPRP